VIRLLAALVLTGATGLAGSAEASDLDGLLSGYSLTSWSDDAGRPLGSVYAIAQDPDGYLWIGADAGLLRFDGWRFTPWESLSEAPIPAAAVRSLALGRDNGLLIGLANPAGVALMRDGKLERYDAGLEGLEAVTELAEDRRGGMWAIADRVLYRWETDRWRRVTLPWKTREGQVLYPLVTRGGELVVGTRWGVFEHAADTNTFRMVSDAHVWGLSEDATGRIWTTDIVAGFRQLGEGAPPRHTLEGAGYRLMHDRQGSLWVATFGDGLWRVVRDGRSFAIERAALRTGLSSDSVQSIMEDRDGNVWVGTTVGLHRLTKRTLTPLEEVGFVLTVQPLANGRVIAGTTNGLVRLDQVGGRWRQTRLGSAMPDIRSIYQDPRGTLWVGATDGLWQYAGGRLTHLSLPSRSDMLVLSISPDTRGGLYLSDRQWLYRWDGSALVPFVAPPESGLTTITFARGDRRGRVWLDFGGKGLGLIDANGAFRLLGTNEGFDPLVRRAYQALYEDDAGVVWLGASDGLIRFADGRASAIGRAQGLPGDRVWAVVDDLQGRLWLSMDRGLVRLARNEIEKAIADRSHRMQYQLYEPLDGLAGAPIGILGSVREPTGRLWFVRGGGVTLVDPAELRERVAGPPPVRIEEAVVNDQRVDPVRDVSFPAGTRRLQVSYTALTLATSSRIRFRYKLEGFDTEWVEAGTRRTAFYTNLSPRSYRFRVEALAEDGTRDTSAAAWSFSVQPAMYQTTWFQILSLGAIVLSIWVAWRFRMRLMHNQFSLVLAERARLSREIHDTLLQSLVGVALQFDHIAEKLGPSSVGARDHLVRVRRQVEAYIRDARESIWDLRSPVLETRDLAAALRDFGRNAVANETVRFTSAVSGNDRDRSPKLENQLLRIGQEAITNAIRHARAKRIHLEIAFSGTSVTLRVSDDGCGFDGEQWMTDTSRHYGLTTMRERAEELGGTLTISTQVGRGTTVEAAIPASTGLKQDLPAAV
jgi:signal transduction histidine kinase/ligand-binding sensor domain-containing protein